MKSVLIMLSTYNGEKYLNELLDSIYQQVNTNIHLLVRDDGSKDNTINILNDYQTSKGQMTIIKGKNIGAKLSFYSLMDCASIDFPNYEYYAFCDQDDVWLKNKLSCAIDKLENMNNSPYKLYGSTLTIVDKQLNKIRQTQTPKHFNYKTSIISNPTAGCCMVMNYNLLSKSNDCIKLILKDIKMQYLWFHDAFVFSIANYFGADIIIDDNSYILYRAHQDNVSVSTRKKSYRAIAFIKRKIVIPNSCQYEAKQLLKIYKGHNDEKELFLNICSNYKESLSSTIRLLHNIDLKGMEFLKRTVTRILIILGKF